MDSAYVPKFHYSRHLPLQADEDDCNPDCFVGERGNSKMKQAADPVDNTSTYESTVLCRTLLKHEQMVQDFHADGLLGKCHEFPEGKLAKHVTWRGNLFRCDDIIFLREAEPFLIEGCAERDGELMLSKSYVRNAAAPLVSNASIAAAPLMSNGSVGDFSRPH